MKTLIINGSPRKNGDTASLINEMKKYLKGDITEISAYYDGIKPCIDCRYCWKNPKCAINDQMNLIYADDFDNVVVASPVYISGLPGPLISLASRLQVYYASKRFLNQKIELQKKDGILILVSGGDGGPENAIQVAKWMLKKMNATYNEENFVFSLNTDKLPASKDLQALQIIKKVSLKLNEKITK